MFFNSMWDSAQYFLQDDIFHRPTEDVWNTRLSKEWPAKTDQMILYEILCPGLYCISYRETERPNCVRCFRSNNWLHHLCYTQD